MSGWNTNIFKKLYDWKWKHKRLSSFSWNRWRCNHLRSKTKHNWRCSIHYCWRKQKPFYVETGLESKLIDVTPSARFRTKANPTEEGWKNFQLPLNGILADSAINTSSFWCKGKNFSTLLQEIQLLMVLYRETPEKKLKIVFMKDWTQTVIFFSFIKIQFWQKNKSRHNMTSFWEDTILIPILSYSNLKKTIR